MIKTKFELSLWRDSFKNHSYHSKKNSETGITFLDDCGKIVDKTILGIFSGTGIGKTSTALNMALHNSIAGRKVIAVFLEAYPGEVQDRRILDIFCKKYFKNPKDGYVDPTLANLKSGALDSALKPLMNEIKSELDKQTNNLTIVTKKNTFDLMALLELIEMVKSEKPDLFILDHIHALDHHNSDGEVRALSDIIELLELLVMTQSIPVVVFGQFRKSLAGKAQKYKGKDDVHGSAQLIRKCTEVVTITREEDLPGGTRTVFSVLKSRLWQKQGFSGCHVFSFATQSYQDKYQLGKIEKDAFVLREVIPGWAKGAQVIR